MREVVIIGGVAAGMSCAAKLHRSADDVNITVYEKGENISYGACGLPYYIGDDIKELDSLIIKKPEDYDDERISIKIHHEVTEVKPDQKKVIVKDTESGKEFEKEYDELVITVGTSPILPPFVDLEMENVFKLRTIEDGKKIKEAALKDDVKNVIIVGGGYIGIELVESFYNLGKNVSVINRSERIMGSFDQEIREIILEELREKKVNLYLNDDVEDIIADDSGRVKSVKTSEGEYEADLVVVAIGVKPNTAFLKDTGIEMMDNGAIIIDEKMKTNLDNIYSAGDCASLYHRVLDELVNIPLATYANKEGRLLAEIIAGKDKTFKGGLGTSAIKVLDLEVSQTGLNEHQAEKSDFEFDTKFIKAKSHAGYYPGAEDLHVKIIFEKETERILGAQLVGKQGAALRINAMALAVENEMTLQELAYSDFAYAPPFSGTWDPVQVAANVASRK